MFDRIVEDLQSIVIIDANVKDVCESIEDIISEQYRLAFPVNLSINEVAAHSTASYNESRVLKKGDVVKIDFGYIDDEGMVVDNAITVSLDNTHKDIIDTTKKSVENAINTIRPGIKVYQVSSVIQETLESKGYKVIENLTGHRISKNYIHDDPPLPAVKNDIDYEFQVGDRFAIEVFATYQEGAGMVVESDKVEIFSLQDMTKSKVPRTALRVYEYIYDNYQMLPFARRWLIKKFGIGITDKAIVELLYHDFLQPYPELVEKNKTPVIQYERTVVIEESNVKIL